MSRLKPAPTYLFLAGAGLSFVGAGFSRRVSLVILAILADRAPRTERLRFADAPAVKNLDVGGQGPHFLRKRSAQLRFHLARVITTRNPDPVRDAKHVTIDRESGHAECVPEHDVGRLSSDTGQGREQLHVRRHFAPVLRDELVRHPKERTGLLAEKAGRDNLPLEVCCRRPGKRLRVGITLEQGRRHEIDARVGGLRRKNRGHKELVRVPVLEFRVRVRVLLRQRVDDAANDCG